MLPITITSIVCFLSLLSFQTIEGKEVEMVDSPAALHGINIYMIGFSVMRHYSFSFLSYLDEQKSDISMNRTEEKTNCNGLLGMASCEHYSLTSETFIRFFWKIKFGNSTCSDVSRDFCYGIDDDSTEHCLSILMPQDPSAETPYITSQLGRYGIKQTTSRDVLTIQSLPTDVELWCHNFQSTCELNGGGDCEMTTFFQKLLSSYDITWGLPIDTIFEQIQNGTVQRQDMQHLITIDKVEWAGRMLLSVFPGKILWVSFPLLDVHRIAFAEDYINDMIEVVNKMVQSGIELIDSPRLKYVDISGHLKRNFANYNDYIHHTGKVSELVIDRFVSELSTMSVSVSVC